MGIVVEARRLNGTDRRKTIHTEGIRGKLQAVTHAAYREHDGTETPYVQVLVNGEPHVLRPSDKVTIIRKKTNL